MGTSTKNTKQNCAAATNFELPAPKSASLRIIATAMIGVTQAIIFIGMSAASRTASECEMKWTI